MKMRKVAGVVAVVVFALGMFSCQPESSVEEADALYDIQATDGNKSETSQGSGGN